MHEWTLDAVHVLDSHPMTHQSCFWSEVHCSPGCYDTLNRDRGQLPQVYTTNHNLYSCLCIYLCGHRKHIVFVSSCSYRFHSSGMYTYMSAEKWQLTCCNILICITTERSRWLLENEMTSMWRYRDPTVRLTIERGGEFYFPSS